jgi:hypothetical protein
MKKIDLGVVVTTLIIVTISCSLAFFAARVIGNPKDINLVAKNVAITFTDTSSIASDVISPGWNNVKTFTITNNSKEDFSYNITLKGLVNTFESINTLQYKITSDNGYNMDNYLNVIKTETSKDVVLAYNITIPKNTIQSYQVEFNYVSTEEDQSADMGKKLGGTLAIEESTGKPEIYEKLLADNPTIKTRTDFSTTFTETNVNTLYKAKENNTDVYYFAGDARNNWVKFGTWQEDKSIVVGYLDDVSNGNIAKEFNNISECNSDGKYGNCEEIVISKKGDPMYWRVIRTNEDGSIRLLYSGTSPETQTGFIGTSAINNEQVVDPLYLGYMYGTSGSLENNRTNENSSTLKTYIDTWYKSNLVNYTKYLSTTAVYCNDRTLSVSYPNYVIGEWMGFAGSDRLETNKAPSYNCAKTEDKFTTDSSVGNGKLTYPIALMTADEVAYAGGVFYTESKYPFYWVYNNADNISITNSIIWWTMTPNSGSPNLSTGGGSWFGVNTTKPGRIGNPGRIDPLAVRPVISLKADMVYKSGDGSAEAPYEIEETLYQRLLTDKSTVISEPRGGSFSEVFESDNIKTLYTSTESIASGEEKTVYYFAGNATDNWVKFANLYWRIIRTNSDNSIRLLYHGTSTDTTQAYIATDTAFNTEMLDSLYAGYMYGTSGSLANNRNNTKDSTIKKVVDNWYKDNLNDYTKYLSLNAVYCSDREVVNGTYGVSGVEFDFAAYTRRKNYTPSYNCANIKDAFSVNNSEAKLRYPIGLMTSDEAAFAGSLTHNASNTYLGYNSLKTNSTGTNTWWLMTPAYAKTNGVRGHIIIPTTSVSTLDTAGVNLTSAVRPAISLKADVVYKSGDGSVASPYEILTN